MSRAAVGFAVLVAAAPRKGSCCGGCDDAHAHGVKTPCEEAAERKALVAGITADLKTAQWFLDNRWPIIGVSFAAGALLFATASYFVNRND